MRLGGRGGAVDPDGGIAAGGPPTASAPVAAVDGWSGRLLGRNGSAELVRVRLGGRGGAVSPNSGVAAVGDPLRLRLRLQRWMVGRGACWGGMVQRSSSGCG